jgi:hypothetical protein
VDRKLLLQRVLNIAQLTVKLSQALFPEPGKKPGHEAEDRYNDRGCSDQYCRSSLHVVDDPEWQVSIQECWTVPVEISGGIGHWIFRIALRWKFAGALEQSSIAVHLHQGLRQEINDLRMKIVAHEDGVSSPD